MSPDSLCSVLDCEAEGSGLRQPLMPSVVGSVAKVCPVSPDGMEGRPARSSGAGNIAPASAPAPQSDGGGPAAAPRNSSNGNVSVFQVITDSCLPVAPGVGGGLRAWRE